jgi:hypothetical protein
MAKKKDDTIDQPIETAPPTPPPFDSLLPSAGYTAAPSTHSQRAFRSLPPDVQQHMQSQVSSLLGIATGDAAQLICDVAQNQWTTFCELLQSAKAEDRQAARSLLNATIERRNKPQV